MLKTFYNLDILHRTQRHLISLGGKRERHRATPVPFGLAAVTWRRPAAPWGFRGRVSRLVARSPHSPLPSLAAHPDLGCILSCGPSLGLLLPVSRSVLVRQRRTAVAVCRFNVRARPAGGVHGVRHLSLSLRLVDGTLQGAWLAVTELITASPGFGIPLGGCDPETLSLCTYVIRTKTQL